MRRAPEGSRENSQERLLLLNFRRDFCFVTENIFTVAREIGSFLFLSFFPSSLSLSCTGGSFHRRLFRCCLNPHGLSSFIFQTLKTFYSFFSISVFCRVCVIYMGGNTVFHPRLLGFNFLWCSSRCMMLGGLLTCCLPFVLHNSLWVAAPH